MKLGAPQEIWLKGGTTDLDHERFAAAMMRCQHGGGYCGQDGVCHHDGDCFRSARQAARQAAARIRAITVDSAEVQGWINDAAAWVIRTASAQKAEVQG